MGNLTRSDYASWPTAELLTMKARAQDRMTRADEAGYMVDWFAVQEIDAVMATRPQQVALATTRPKRRKSRRSDRPAHGSQQWAETRIDDLGESGDH